MPALFYKLRVSGSQFFLRVTSFIKNENRKLRINQKHHKTKEVCPLMKYRTEFTVINQSLTAFKRNQTFTRRELVFVVIFGATCTLSLSDNDRYREVPHLHTTFL